jgi:dipeptidyl aminopeptidase/acylaminoacyl peptidase
MRSAVRAAILAAAAIGLGGAARAADLADSFGAMEMAWSVRLSPSGKYLSWVTPGPTRDTVLMVSPVDGSTPPVATLHSGTSKGFRLAECDWAGDEDLWCVLTNEDKRSEARSVLAYSRLLAVKRNGSNMRPLGRPLSARALAYGNSDGRVLYSMKDEPTILVASYLPEENTAEGGATLIANAKGGIVVERLNVATGKRAIIEKSSERARWYLADQAGEVRLLAAETNSKDNAYDVGRRTFQVRPKGSRTWVTFGRDEHYGENFQPLGFDESGEWVFTLIRGQDSRLALWKVAANESGRRELVYADPKVDVGGIAQIGGQNRAVGYSWEDETTHIRYFDPELEKLDAQLRRTVKGRAIAGFSGESAAHDRLLVYLGSDRDPGQYFLLDKPTHQLKALLPLRMGVDPVKLGEMRDITYSARDGAKIPAYLTVPTGREAKNLPLIVMPHGGPTARDSWGFDWLVQYYVAQGYAVVQPNYRGSSGYGKSFSPKTAIENWRTAISDINDSARALAAEGVADPKRTAIVGWSYGGYSALQASAVEPGLYRAAVAVAPVTDWVKMKRFATNNAVAGDRLTNWQFGSSDQNLAEGSPARLAARLTTPVLMFHGDKDANVPIDQSRDMLAALNAAGHPAELITYPGLEHSLMDGTVRADMLRKSAAFLERAMGGAKLADAR